MMNRLRIGDIRVQLCFDFRQRLAYAGLFFEAVYVGVSLMSDFRQASNAVPYTSSSQNSA